MEWQGIFSPSSLLHHFTYARYFARVTSWDFTSGFELSNVISVLASSHIRRNNNNSNNNNNNINNNNNNNNNDNNNNNYNSNDIGNDNNIERYFKVRWTNSAILPTYCAPHSLSFASVYRSFVDREEGLKSAQVNFFPCYQRILWRTG